jgi:hypothetical protein
MINENFNLADVDDKLINLLLYCVDNNINLFKYCGISSEKELIITDELEILRIFKIWSDKKLIYLSPDGTWQLNTTVNQSSIPKRDLITSIREFWSSKYIGVSGKSSNNNDVKRALELFNDSSSVSWSNSDIITACKKYVDMCLATSRFLKDCDNFIYDNTGKSMLMTMLEDKETTKEEYDNVI